MTDPHRRSRRVRAALIALVLIPIGIGTKLYTGPGAAWVMGNLGGAVYVTFWAFAAVVLRPVWSIRSAALGAFVATSLIEVLQLWHPPFLESLRATVPGQALLGGVFAWMDYPFYALGAFAAVVVGRLFLIPPPSEASDSTR